MVRNNFGSLVLFGIPLMLASLLCGNTDAPVLTHWSVEGAGWVQNRELHRQLEAILPESEPMNTNDVEDATMILLSIMQQKGYLDARVETRLHGRYLDAVARNYDETVVWDRRMETYLQVDVLFSEVYFRIIPGRVFYYESLELPVIEGLDSARLESFFYRKPMLFQSAKVKRYNPDQFQKACRNVESYFDQRGYLDAQVTGETLHMDWDSGAVQTKLSFSRGKQHLLDRIDVEADNLDVALPFALNTWDGRPFSRELKQDILKRIRSAYFELGYPEVSISSRVEAKESDGVIRHHVFLAIKTGPRKLLGQVQFSGLQQTRESFLRKQLMMKSGDPFDPGALDKDRLKLSQTGLFDVVKVNLNDVDDIRNVEFELEERYPWTLDLFTGWGSYEQLRFGTTLQRDNLWGQAHQLYLKAVASFKSVYSETVYTIPDIRRTGINFSERAFSLNREEVSFDRKERGLDLSLTKRFDRYGLDTSLVYSYEILESIDRQLRSLIDDENSKVGSLSIRISKDKRDNPISPKSGYRIYTNLEWADSSLGGDVRYWSGEIGFSDHFELGSGLLIHTGFSLGIVSTPDSFSNYIPNNKLYFPGGDDSIRGYQRGEAAPKDANGFLIGARSFTLANLEIEQHLTDHVSAVLFYDWLGTATESVIYTYTEDLQSVGLGLRWKTVIGPLRLEYGHNLNRRVGDPHGTFHLALGIPF